MKSNDINEDLKHEYIRSKIQEMKNRIGEEDIEQFTELESLL